MKTFKFLIPFCFLVFQCLSQVNGIDDAYLKLPVGFSKVVGKNGLYENRDESYDYGETKEICIKNLQLNTDSSFYYYGLSGDTFYFSLGKYRFENELFWLNWNEQQTKKAILDSAGFCKTHFPSRTVHPIKITNIKYSPSSKNSGLTKQPIINRDSAELFYNSFDFYSKPAKTPYKTQYTSYSRDGAISKKDSMSNEWGRRIVLSPDGRYGRLYRNYNGVFRRIVQIDGIVIYKLDLVGRRFKWSKTRFLFSKTADSEILPLTKKKLKKEFYNNPVFLKMIRYIWVQNHYLNQHPLNDTDIYKFKLVELYKKSLEMNKAK